MYNTLSYTWDDPENCGCVVIEGHQFPVTKNLEAALRAKRKTKSAATNLPKGVTQSPSYRWIDVSASIKTTY